MTTQRTHLLALRAASKVTAVSQVFRRLAVGAAASAILAGSTFGCSTDSDIGATTDAAMSDSTGSGDVTTMGDDITTVADIAGLMDTILSGEDSTTPDDDTSAIGEDGGNPNVGMDVALGDAGQPDVGTPDAGVVDVGTVDIGAVDIGSVDTGSDPVDAGEADVTVADAGVLPDDCLIPNGESCETANDCQVEDKYSFMCVEGECHEMDITPNEEAMACCQHQYDAGNFGVLGCNPWGPPAPTVDRGYRLDELAETLGIA